MANEIKIGKFTGRTSDDTAPVTVDGREIGWLERDTVTDWSRIMSSSDSAIHAATKVTGYILVVTDESIGLADDVSVKSKGEAIAAIRNALAIKAAS